MSGDGGAIEIKWLLPSRLSMIFIVIAGLPDTHISMMMMITIKITIIVMITLVVIVIIL